ncbi:hypothetical protein AB0K09_08165 [Streptomyces sp. NPDC049577]|uniref:hypothetical protein n=1 Tax=Streptomyces sp. NPDC049577 TaxID=3155153 RepID=UPI00343903CB
MTVRSAWLLNRSDADGGQTRADTRLAPTGTAVPAGPLSSRDGVIPGSADGKSVIAGLTLTKTGNMTAQLSPGRALVQGSDTAGAYPVVVTDYENLTFADGDASNPRVDLVVLHVYDQQQESGAVSRAVVEIIKGTPAAAPTAPTTPPAALALYAVTVPVAASAGNTGINWATGVSDRRRATVAVGGIVPLGWGLNFQGAYPGQYRDTGSGLERWNGTAWTAYPPAPVWTDYTPVWRSENGVQPVIGNGTLAGSSTKIGTTVHVRIYLKIGSTTNLTAQDPNANWSFSLPYPPSATAWKTDGRFMNALGYDSSTSPRMWSGTGLLATTNGGVVRSIQDSVGSTDGKPAIWDKTAPYTWKAGDVLTIWGTYEAAS